MPKRPDVVMRRLAAETMLRRLRELRQWAPVVIAGVDTEGVHQMRVASRRLRSTMSAFRSCLPKQRRGGWRKAIRRITRRLGPARDLDVQIALVETFELTHESINLRPGLDYLLGQFRAERAGLQPGLVKAVAKLQASDELRQMRRRMGALRRAARAHGPADWTDSAANAARASAGAHALRRARDMIRWEPSLLSPDAHHQHHEMRKAAKRLRYVIEAFDPLWGGRLEPAVETVRGFQKLLGQLHDCDVWIEILPDWIDRAAREGCPDAAPGLQVLLDDRKRLRGETWRQFLAVYRAAQGRGFWEQFFRVLHARPARPTEAGR